jgi:pimeloyl-ACP methyl ester carboxylesterase
MPEHKLTSSSFLLRCVVAQTIAFLLLYAAAPGTQWAQAAQTKDQQKCAGSIDKAWGKSVKAATKDLAGCMKTVSKGAGGAAACLGADSKGKVAAARGKMSDAYDKACLGGNAPTVGWEGTTPVFRQAETIDDSMAVALFGADPASALTFNDPAELGGCQGAVQKSLAKCVDTQIKTYAACKKAAFKDDNDTLAALASCYAADPKGKIAKACDLDAGGKVDKIRAAFGKNCVGTDLAVAFPGCNESDPELLHACLLAPTTCSTCLSAASSHGIEGLLDCDILDNATADRSCTTIFSTQVTVANSVEPAETPGSPGVVPTNPKLLAQFGGDTFNLNQSSYVRWRASGPEVQPDAIFIAVGGFGSDANNFLLMAQDLIPKIFASDGLRVELWGYRRRSNPLEDREGSLLAIKSADAIAGLDWYFGEAMGLTLDPTLVAGPNRRAEFYNKTDDIPFLANWTTQVHSRDIDVVVELARATALNNNVFLGGHSAGTGFTARYAATDFDIAGGGPVEPGYSKLRGLILLEGGGGNTSGSALTADSVARIEDKFDGGLFGAVRDQAPRCADGLTTCTVDTEGADCSGIGNARCTEPTDAYAAVGGLGAQITAISEVQAIQGITDPNVGVSIVQVDQTGPDTSAIDLVPELSIVGLLPGDATVDALFGTFLDDDELGAGLSPALGTSLGGLGPDTTAVTIWKYFDEVLPASKIPYNGPAPTTIGATLGERQWGQEVEVVSLKRYRETFIHGESNAADWYYSSSGQSLASSLGRCVATVCTKGNVGAACAADGDCAQSVSLDSSAVSATRPDIVNLTQAGNIDIPVICFGGSNGLAPLGASFKGFADSLTTCASPSCTGTARVVNAVVPSEAFPTFGDVDGGYEVYIIEGFAHSDVIGAEDTPPAGVLGPLAAFIARNSVL